MSSVSLEDQKFIGGLRRRSLGIEERAMLAERRRRGALEKLIRRWKPHWFEETDAERGYREALERYEELPTHLRPEYAAFTQNEIPDYVVRTGEIIEPEQTCSTPS